MQQSLKKQQDLTKMMREDMDKAIAVLKDELNLLRFRIKFNEIIIDELPQDYRHIMLAINLGLLKFEQGQLYQKRQQLFLNFVIN